MSQQAKANRPAQATFAGWLIMGGSIIVVMSAWERIAGLTSIETRESLQAVLADPPFSNTGLTLDDLSTLIRIGAMAAAGAATAAAILAFHALRRSRSARLALSILAPVLLIGGFATAGFFAPMVVAGIVMLWLSPSREWFAGRRWEHPAVSTAPAAPNPAQGRVDPDLPDPFTKPEQDPENTGGDSSAPAPAAGGVTGSAPVAVSNFGAPTPQAAYAAGPDVARRPAALVWACAIVWSMSAVVSSMMVLLTVVLLVAREDFFAEVEQQQPDFDFGGFSHGEVAAAVFTMTGLVLVWSALAVVLAFLAFRRAAWARVALLVSTGMVGLVSLAMVVASPPMLVVAASAGTAAWLLLRPEVVGWFRR